MTALKATFYPNSPTSKYYIQNVGKNMINGIEINKENKSLKCIELNQDYARM